MDIIKELPTYQKETENPNVWYISGISRFTLPVIIPVIKVAMWLKSKNMPRIIE